ncbi:MAG: OmpA family protein [Pseudomonadota bacterium]
MDIVKSDPRFSGRTPDLPQRRPGNWKLAYADFLTALCAFFLVMWMVHGVSAQDKADLANQFSSAPSEAEVEPSVAASLQSQARLQPYLPFLRFEETQTSLRIDLTDLNERALFDTGSALPNSDGAAILEAVGKAVAVLPFPLRVEGHTDSRPIQGGLYSNWDLSTNRANAARRALIEAGLNADQIAAVTGLADTQPLFPETPDLPANRRISIVLDLAPTQASAGS